MKNDTKITDRSTLIVPGAGQEYVIPEEWPEPPKRQAEEDSAVTFRPIPKENTKTVKTGE